MEDSSIIALFFERSEQAITELASKYGRAILSVSQNILKNLLDAEENVNDTYIGVWNTVPPKEPDSLYAYSVRLARNGAVSRYRANTAEKRNTYYDSALDELSECLPSPKSVEAEYEVRELTNCVNRFLDTLPREERVMFVRRYWYADPVSKIAEHYSLPPNRVSVKLSRVRKKLAAYLIKEGMIS